MPVKLGSKLAHGSSEAHIEIVPLIDIMFFLLASFMLVSLSTVHLKTVKINLPTATTATPETQKNLLNLTVNKAGVAFLDARPVGEHELTQTLAARHQMDPALRIIVSGDQDARHGDVLHVLDLVRSAGIQNVAFETRPITAP